MTDCHHGNQFSNFRKNIHLSSREINQKSKLFARILVFEDSFATLVMTVSSKKWQKNTNNSYLM